MKKFIFASLLAFAACFDAAAQEYKVVTVVESIVPGGVGRSRIIEATSQVDSDSATTERIDGKKSDQGKVKRGDQKIEAFKETKLLNFFAKPALWQQVTLKALQPLRSQLFAAYSVLSLQMSWYPFNL